jgi:hypothetical protein
MLPCPPGVLAAMRVGKLYRSPADTGSASERSGGNAATRHSRLAQSDGRRLALAGLAAAIKPR